MSLEKINPSEPAGRFFEIVVGSAAFLLGLLLLSGGVNGLFQFEATPGVILALVILWSFGWVLTQAGWRLLRGKSGRSDGLLLSPWLFMIIGGVFLLGSLVPIIAGKEGAVASGAMLTLTAGAFALGSLGLRKKQRRK